MSFHLTTNTLLFIIWGLLALSLNPFYCIRMNNWNVLEQSVDTIDLIVDSVLTADKSVISELLWRIQKIKLWKMWGAKCILVMERLLHMNSVVILWQLHLFVFKVNTLSDSLRWIWARKRDKTLLLSTVENKNTFFMRKFLVLFLNKISFEMVP